MIEFTRAEFEDWRVANNALTLDLVRFYEYRCRIDGVEYDTSSKDFKEAFNKEKMWERLNDS